MTERASVREGALVGYFAKREEARRALRELGKRGFRRAALIHKGAGGDIRTWDPFLLRRAFWVVLSATGVAGLAGIATAVLRLPIGIVAGSAPGAVAVLAGGLVGAFLGAMWMRRSKYGVARGLLEDHARWLVSEETALVLEVPIEALRLPVALVRESGEIPPAVFVLHPKCESPTGDVSVPTVPLSMAQIQEYAPRAAGEHRVDPDPERAAELLKRLGRSRQWIHQVCLNLAEAGRVGQTVPPTAEWLLDNEYIVESNIREVQLNLPRRFYRELPVLLDEPYRGLPRIYGLAMELVSHTDLRLDRENIIAFVEAYQDVGQLSTGELWALPQMLRVALIESVQNLATRALTELRERGIADFWANRLITANRRDPNQVFAFLAELAAARPDPSPYFASQLIDHLYDEEAALGPVRGWLERTLRRPLSDLDLREQNRQTKDRISIGNAFTSLRQLALLDWRQLFEELSRVERVLRLDPAGVYPKMDFQTRDRYRCAVEELARGSGQAEPEVARRAIEMAGETARGERRGTPRDDRWAHVGTYLVGDARPELARLLDCPEKMRRRALQWVYRHHSRVYFLGLGISLALLVSLVVLLGLRGQAVGIRLLVALLLIVPASQLALDVLNYLATRLLPPRTLPKMDFETAGIPDACRTLVVVPMLLVDAETVRAEVEKLEIRYLANKEANLVFSLFTDYTDSTQLHCGEDEALLKAATESLDALNHRYGGDGGGRFFLLHRERRWSRSERKFIGWERKRGKLEELNRLIDGTRPDDAARLVYVGDPDQLASVRFVITLDSDTQLPHGAARRMVETLAHPLNRPRLDGKGGVLAGTCTVIQPRVSPSLPSTSGSPFSRLFSDAVGIDPYTKAVSDINQDLTGEGSYHGKGIYDVRTFSRVLSGTFPEERLLSHDLIEGAHVRVGLASDIELYDEFPQDYLSYTSRQHRWIRGDWQIAEWILPRVPRPGGRGPNPISWFDRWKIFDNLRRSLVPATSLGLLVASWLVSAPMAWISFSLVGVLLIFAPLVEPFTWATTGRGLKSFSLSKAGHDLVRAVVDASLLPHQAWLALDAILRVGYRRLVSHRNLLEWTSAEVMQWNSPGHVRMFVVLMSLAGVLSVAVAGAVERWRPSSLSAAAPWLALWLASPLVGWLLTRRPNPKQQQLELRERDLRFLRGVARRTWSYFSDFVGEETSYLPPDNYQVSHRNQLAMRTSPTNIGLWMVSALGAHDFGYLTVDDVVDRLTRTLKTVGKLERYEGHLLNWYDVKTLSPLEPRYVSTVDSGNLLGALWCLEQGLEDIVRDPILGLRTFEGLRDAVETLEEVADFDPRLLDDVVRVLESPPERVADALGALRRLEGAVKTLAEKVGMPAVSGAGAPAAESAGAARATVPPEGEAPDARSRAARWVSEIASQVAAWRALADRYLTWIEILDEKSEDEIAQLGAEAIGACRQDLARAPSLLDLAAGQVASVQVLRSIREAAPQATGPMFEWLDRLVASFAESKWLAGEMQAAAERLAKDGRELSESMNMRFLYDTPRRLFSVGYNVSEGRRDSAYYDLFASEARFGSFVAIARGDVPVEHWFSMSRPYGAIGRHRVLLSWTGTMFEYLMPLLFQRSYGNSLMDKAARDAVSIQIAYGRKRRVPWGISESAYGDLDLTKTYQYKAFGVPELGLKRGLEEEVVVAPYASLLAVGLAPRQTVRNLKRLAGLGLLGDYGYYEAMDFSRQPGHEGDRGVVVRAYMAHHQGMSFLALANLVHDNSIQRRFHADPRVRAVEPLLHERVPVLPPLHHISTRERVPSVKSVGEVAPSVSKFDTPHTSAPKTQLLSNGRYSLMVTNAGGGYSRWGEHEITRWRSDRTEDRWGTFCYIREGDSDRLWSNTYHPVGGKAETYSASFALDRAVFRRVDGGIHTDTEVVVSPEDDVEIRRITLVNRSIRTRRLELTSYVELSMAAHGADLQHPAFNKLFVATEAVSDQRALLAHRRPRSDADPAIYIAHRLTLEGAIEGAEAGPLEFETDRRRFIGRGRTLARPMGVFRKLTNTQGFVLDPILSLRQNVTLRPAQRVQVTMVIAAAQTREEALRLAAKYGDAHAVHRAMDFAWASAQLELRLLRIQPDDARRFQHLASYLLYPNPLMRPSADCIEENRKGQAGLWPYGISGDLPIALVTIGEARDIALVRQMLEAHTYWRKHGLVADLVILNEEPGGYELPLRERLEGLIRTHSVHTGIDKPGGVYLRSADLIPDEDQTLLKAAASLLLVAARGTFPQQLGVPLEPPELPEPLGRKRARREPSPVLPFLELPYFNSLGGFTPDGREYAIYLGPDTHTPAPWVNVIANPTFGTLVSETGSGFTWYGNSRRNRMTQWSNDPVVDPPPEAIYVRDEETGACWTPTPAPIREDTAYRTRHGAGYTVFEHNSHGIEQELTVFVPVDERGGAPIKLQRLRLKNDSARRRTLSVTYYVEWTLGENREASQMHITTSWEDEVGAVFARNRYHPEYGDRVAFAALSVPADSYTGDRTSFLGRNRSTASPVAMERVRLSRRTGAGLDPCAALQTTLELAPGETAEITCLLGQAASVEDVHDLIATYRADRAVDEALEETKAWWDDLLGTIEVHTPELAADFLINRWLAYQSLICRIWGRSAFYQSGGAFGFRDQLQDVMGLVSIRPELAREHILVAASRQFREGDVQHWWHPPSGAGLRSRISDDLLWLPYVVAQYVRVTGDRDVLREEVPFLDSPRLKDDEKEVFATPKVALERATLFEHCRRAVTRSLAFGSHGLPLMGTGDWNDGMNLVGAAGKGESVWLAWFLAGVLEGMAEMADLVGPRELGEAYREERGALLQRIERTAWDGKWYLRAIFDDGTPLGSRTSKEAQIDSLTQSWAWLGGGAGRDGANGNRATNDRAAKAIESAWSHLVREDEGLVLLLAPPFDKSEPSPGYIKAYPPGVRENGGQYTHAAVWLAMALARRGDGGRAVSILRMLNPIERARDSDSVWRYGIEPYVVAADVYRLPGWIGHGGWSWYTGAASWMYMAWVEEVLGLKVRGDHLKLDPVIPEWWVGFSLRYRHGEAVYEIRVENPDRCERGVAWVEIDGKRLTDGAVPLERNLVKHRVLVRMGNP